MTLEDQLKSEILKKYKSIRVFSATIDMPYSTIDSVLKRGVKNAGVNTMLKIFDALGLDIESIKDGNLRANEEKKSPELDEASTGEISLEESNDLLVALGYIKPGEQLSDEDLMFLTHLIGLLDAWFDRGS